MTALSEDIQAGVTAGEDTWVFTFGSGHRLYIMREDLLGRVGEGVSMTGRFVRLPGTYDSARARFQALFGTAYCDQYTAARGAEIIARYGLTELVVVP